MTPEKKKFRVSSALKNIIGKELITDDFIAVFELVKNAFDAHASRVEITFEGLATDSPYLIIKDDGKGMDKRDIEEKWLFVAYSAKKEGVEDYRDKIQSERIHAGAKGIGRFSCDKLGTELTIYSKKNKGSKTLHKLDVNWLDFEKDPHTDFIRIQVIYSLTAKNSYNLGKGTVLEIRGLREPWDRKKLIELRRSLEKLINPNQGNNTRDFSIYLNAPDEIEGDKNIKDKESWNKVNGKIKNLLFEKLNLKTTQIHTCISEDGQKINTRLEDRGVLIYHVVEKNPYFINGEPLQDICIHLFALNQPAKTFFTTYMGLRVVSYGSVFLYKNGFRIYPFGEVGDDRLLIDRRKQQMGSRALGSRDLIGRIEITGKNPSLQETTSRDGGLVKNEHYEKLIEFFNDFALKRLERFAIDVIKFGIYEVPEDSIAKSSELQGGIFELIKNLTKPDAIIDIKYGQEILPHIEVVAEKSLKAFLKVFKQAAAETKNPALIKDVARAQKRIEEFERAKEEAEHQVGIEVAAKRKAEEGARSAILAYETERKKNLFFKSTKTDAQTTNIALVHHIKLMSDSLTARVRNLYRDIKNDVFDKNKTLEYLAQIQLQVEKILKLSDIVSVADINFKYSKVEGDLVRFLYEYLNELRIASPDIDISVETGGLSHITKFSVLEVSIIIDNMISNSRKAGAKRFLVQTEKDKEKLLIRCSDDGEGINSSAVANIFEPGFTTRRGGSGIGLYTVQELVHEMGGKVSFDGNGKKLRGATFSISIK